MRTSGNHAAGITTGIIFGAIIACILTILVFIFIMPEKRRVRNTGFKKKLGDLFSMDYLLTERINTFLYVLISIGCVVSGLFTMFSKSGFLSGLGIMLLGPIVSRIVYEYLMLFVILTRQSMQINAKLGRSPIDPKDVRSPRHSVAENGSDGVPYADHDDDASAELQAAKQKMSAFASGVRNMADSASKTVREKAQSQREAQKAAAERRAAALTRQQAAEEEEEEAAAQAEKRATERMDDVISDEDDFFSARFDF